MVFIRNHNKKLLCDGIIGESLSYHNSPKTLSLHLNEFTTISINLQKTSGANAREEDNGSKSQAESTDMRQDKSI